MNKDLSTNVNLDASSSSTTPQIVLKSIDYDASSFITSANKDDVVGNGTYGVVRRCCHEDLGNVVVKCMYCAGSTDSTIVSIKEAQKQVRFLTRFKHKHIVRTLGLTSWGHCFGIIMEEVKCGNLRDLMIVNQDIIDIEWKLRYRIVFQLADALNYLHNDDPKKSYIHLDIKPENVLLTNNLNVKVADFGSLEIAIVTGATATTTELSSSTQYTPLYTAPERLLNVFDTKASCSMDVYSFAMICYEVITRQAVFQDARANVNLLLNLIASRGQKPNTKLLDNVEQKLKKQSSADLKIFQQLKHIMKSCWCSEAEERFSIKKVHNEMKKFAGSENPFKSDIDHSGCADQIAKFISENKKRFEEYEIRLPLKFHFPPFHEVANLNEYSSDEPSPAFDNSKTNNSDQPKPGFRKRFYRKKMTHSDPFTSRRPGENPDKEIFV